MDELDKLTKAQLVELARKITATFSDPSRLSADKLRRAIRVRRSERRMLGLPCE